MSSFDDDMPASRSMSYMDILGDREYLSLIGAVLVAFALLVGISIGFGNQIEEVVEQIEDWVVQYISSLIWN